MTEFIKWFKLLRYETAFRLLTKKGVPLTTLGRECHWTFFAPPLNQSSIIYSVGVGKDITFENALCHAFGCQIVLLDPTPTAARTMASTAPPNRGELIFIPEGLAGETGLMSFGSPNNPIEGSYVLGKESSDVINLPCTSVTDLMRRLGHTRVDLLKMDIEGAEYKVIDHILKYHLPIGQICVEFHHWTPGFRRQQTHRALAQLIWAGYRLIHKHSEEYSFVHRSIISGKVL